MQETFQTNYQSIPDMAQDEARVPWKKFFVYLAGRTDGAHQPIVNEFKAMGQTEVSAQEQSDYVLLFCPIASRVGTDIEEALSNVHADKPAALMVMHYTFDCDRVVADSRRLVDDLKVPLTADFLSYNGKLLKSDRNKIAFYDIQKFFGFTPSQDSDLQNIRNTISIWCRRNRKIIVILLMITILVLVICAIVELVTK